MKSYKLATGADVLFNFKETIPDLELCTQVIEYRLTDIIYTDLLGASYAVDANTLQYYSSCSEIPCLTLTFDVTKSGIIKFRIQPIDSAGQAPTSEQLTITVTENPEPPAITNYLLDPALSSDVMYQSSSASQFILTDTSAKFELQPFFCDTATCKVTNY
jgi:hypothetical protein